MKIRPLIFLLASLYAFSSWAAPRPLVELVNPLMGSDSVRDYSHGNTFPAVALPFSMNAWAPYTQPAKETFFYQYRQNTIRGIRQTHQPSPWMGDYANFSLMPVSGKLAVTETDRASTFTHAQEIAQPGYYRVQLDTWNAVAEVTPTERGACFRFTFNGKGDAYVVLDAFAGKSVSTVEIQPAQRKITGIARNVRGVMPENFANYFVIVFDRPFAAHGTWSGTAVQAASTKLEGSGDPLGAYVKFAPGAKNVVTCRVASSFISLEQAERNLQQEIGAADFDTVHRRADARWNEALGRIQIEGGSAEQQRTFYSAFYRSLLFPQKFYEIGADGKPIYFSPYDGRVHAGFLYTNSGFWDTFRAVHPLMNLLFPEVSAELLPALLNAYDESGWLPAWSSPGHRDIMIGNHAFSLLADGWVKGIRTFDPKKAMDAMAHDADTQSPPKLSAIGRDGAKYYNQLGYVPYSNVPGDPDSVTEAAAKTLEFAYDDFCAAEFARLNGFGPEAELFSKRAMNYANLFDVKTGFMRGRRADGSWNEPFFPDEWGGPFTEGNAWHWTWSVMQDVPGLVALLGGDKAFAEKLDAVFTAEPTFRVGTYKQTIHEMTEMVAANLGQYAHGNEPVHHLLYLYDYVGQPWKTQARIRQVMALLYQPTPDGFCGDEDTGQMSAWYVFSALGFYPVCPGEPNYVIGSPLFDKATLKLANGKTFVIHAKENGAQRYYIKAAELNGQPFNRCYLSHQEIVAGGELVFTMTSAPNYEWAIAPDSRPPSAMAPLRAAGFR
ncbi:alpha-mannosidase [Verrucomicrobia bacterium SCGC AG-212-E04]|nr:alpha-mannosidase [Verrucomicrobia bacterium SCGC AG-212-E04]OAI43381.1 alpha-mannosidase [Verrucomicrobia bacterium SCGC AG-212-E04]